VGKKKVKARLKSGGAVVLIPWGYVYMDHAYAIRNLKKTYGLSVRKTGLKENANILGLAAPQWTEYIRTEDKLDFNTFPRLLAMAEAGWTAPENKNYAAFEKRLESLRGLFQSLNAPLAPQACYRGGSVKGRGLRRLKNGWLAWNKNPQYEVEQHWGEKRE
jgi:N-acetyl-beta-hexosaminidase